MHGTRSNTHFSTFKSSTHHTLTNNQTSKADEDYQDAEYSSKRSKHANGRTRADVENQMLDWQEEIKDIKL